MTSTAEAVDEDRALKARHRAMWALGDYSVVAEEVIPELGPVLVEACEVAPGDRVLDIAAGSGNAARMDRRLTLCSCPTRTAASTSCCPASA